MLRGLERGGVIEDSYPREERVAPTNSHKRQVTNQSQFHPSQTIRRRGSSFASRWMRDDEDELVDVYVPSTPVQDVCMRQPLGYTCYIM